MTTQSPQQQAIIPDLPRKEPMTARDGTLTPSWERFFDQLILALQTNFKPEGIVVPSQTAANITLLTGTQSIANILYDSTNNAFKGNINGTWKTFTLV